MEELLKQLYLRTKSIIYILIAGASAIAFFIYCHACPKGQTSEPVIMLFYLGLFTILYLMITLTLIPRMHSDESFSKDRMTATYAFIALAYGCILCLSIIVAQLSMRAYSDDMDALTTILMNLQPSLTGLFLILAAILLPIYVKYGFKKGLLCEVLLVIILPVILLIILAIANPALCSITYWYELLSSLSSTSILFIVLRIAGPLVGVSAYYVSFRSVSKCL